MEWNPYVGIIQPDFRLNSNLDTVDRTLLIYILFDSPAIQSFRHLYIKGVSKQVQRVALLSLQVTLTPVHYFYTELVNVDTLIR